MKLAFNALIKFFAGLFLVGGILFWSAGSFGYPNGWLLIGLLFLPILILSLVLFFRAPALLQKRLDAKEKENTQKTVVGISAFILAIVIIKSGSDTECFPGYGKTGSGCVAKLATHPDPVFKNKLILPEDEQCGKCDLFPAIQYLSGRKLTDKGWRY